MANYMFGAGTITLGTGPGIVIGTQQGGSLDIDAETIELFGAKEFPVDVASGKKRITGRFSHGELQTDALDKLFGSTAGDVNNALMGASSPFQISWEATYRGQKGTFTLMACVFKKFSLKWGNATHAIVDVEFAAFANSTDDVLTFSVAAA